MDWFALRELREDERETLKEKAELVLKAKLNQNGMTTDEQKIRTRERLRNELPKSIEDLPPRGITLHLTKRQPWKKEVVAMNAWYESEDKENVKFLGFMWCSIARTLTFFDCRNFDRGAYAFFDTTKYN